MAILKGKGAFKDVPLIATIYDNNYFDTKGAKKAAEELKAAGDMEAYNNRPRSAFVEFRLHPDDPRTKGQVFPELRAAEIGKTEDGKPRQG